MTIAHHITANFLADLTFLKWALIHGLFCGGFCNRRTRNVLNILNLVFCTGVGVVFVCTLP